MNLVQQLWIEAYIAALRAGKSGYIAKDLANSAIRDFKQTFHIKDVGDQS